MLPFIYLLHLLEHHLEHLCHWIELIHMSLDSFIKSFNIDQHHKSLAIVVLEIQVKSLIDVRFELGTPRRIDIFFQQHIMILIHYGKC